MRSRVGRLNPRTMETESPRAMARASLPPVLPQMAPVGTRGASGTRAVSPLVQAHRAARIRAFHLVARRRPIAAKSAPKGFNSSRIAAR